MKSSFFIGIGLTALILPPAAFAQHAGMKAMASLPKQHHPLM